MESLYTSALTPRTKARTLGPPRSHRRRTIAQRRADRATVKQLDVGAAWQLCLEQPGTSKREVLAEWWGPDVAELALQAQARLYADRGRVCPPRPRMPAVRAPMRCARARARRTQRVAACAAKPTADPDPETSRRERAPRLALGGRP